MSNSPYKNREIDDKHEQIISRLTEIHEQVKETNGRVTDLEAWRNRIIGAIAVFTTLIIPIALKVFEL